MKGWKYEGYRHSLAAKGVKTKPFSLYAKPPYVQEGQMEVPCEPPKKKEEYDTFLEKGTEEAGELGGQLGEFIAHKKKPGQDGETLFEKSTEFMEKKGGALGDKIFRGKIRF